MIYYIDCEFDGYGGKLISIGIAALNHATFYAVLDKYAYGPDVDEVQECDDWVYDNVIPKLMSHTRFNHRLSRAFPSITHKELSTELGIFFAGDEEIHIIADWPDDIKYFCELLVTGPGTMINIPSITFDIKRVDAYPNDIPFAIQHNAIWDAIALAEYFNPGYWKGPK
jgi:hypothetical protein